ILARVSSRPGFFCSSSRSFSFRSEVRSGAFPKGMNDGATTVPGRTTQHGDSGGQTHSPGLGNKKLMVLVSARAEVMAEVRVTFLVSNGMIPVWFRIATLTRSQGLSGEMKVSP